MINFFFKYHTDHYKSLLCSESKMDFWVVVVLIAAALSILAFAMVAAIIICFKVYDKATPGSQMFTNPIYSRLKVAPVLPK